MSARSSYTTQTEGYNVGFPSPAADYVERRLTVDSLCGTGPNTRIVQTETGYAVVDCSVKPKQGDTVLIQYGGGTDFAKLWAGHLLHETVKRWKVRPWMMLQLSG